MSNEADHQKNDSYLAPGTRVRLDSHLNGSDDLTTEVGIVVHCWLSDEMGLYDCYVAFFGDHFPSGQPSVKPYILRYASGSLITVA